MVAGIACFIAAMAAIVGVTLGLDRPPSSRAQECARNALGIVVTILVIVGMLLLAWSQAS